MCSSHCVTSISAYIKELKLFPYNTKEHSKEDREDSILMKFGFSVLPMGRQNVIHSLQNQLQK